MNTSQQSIWNYFYTQSICYTDSSLPIYKSKCATIGFTFLKTMIFVFMHLLQFTIYNNMYTKDQDCIVFRFGSLQKMPYQRKNNKITTMKPTYNRLWWLNSTNLINLICESYKHVYTQVNMHHMFAVCLVPQMLSICKTSVFHVFWKTYVFKNMCFLYVRLTYVNSTIWKICQQTYVKLMVITYFSYE
jgi:hypothetical protein